MDYDIQYFYKEDLLTVIHVRGRSVAFENYSDEVILIAFGVREAVTYEDLLEFYESRCFPRERTGAKDLLRGLGLDYYDPELICRKTHGMQFDDFMWMQFSDEPQVRYEDIKMRD